MNHRRSVSTCLLAAVACFASIHLSAQSIATLDPALRARIDRIAAQEFDTLSARPAIGTVDKVRLLLRAFFSI